MIEPKTEDGREFVEYEDEKGRRVYTDAEKYAEGEDLTENIPEKELPEGLKDNKEEVPEEVLEKVRGVRGYKKLPGEEKKKFLKDKMGLSKEEGG